jgi:hypothetical protein
MNRQFEVGGTLGAIGIHPKEGVKWIASKVDSRIATIVARLGEWLIGGEKQHD